MRVLITGASGFLGKEISENFAVDEVFKLSRSSAQINVDLTTQIPSIPKVDLVIHCAGKAHTVPKSKIEEEHFFQTNVLGTENLLLGIEQSNQMPKAIVYISSVSVYGQDSGILISEKEPLNAKDAYGLSKIRAESILSDWCIKHDVICTILRLPLLVGKNPPGNLGAMIAGIKKGYYFNVAGGNASKSMVLIKDIANIIKRASEVGGVFNLTDGMHPTFNNFSKQIAMQMGKKQPLNLPLWLARMMAKLGDFLGPKSPINSNKLRKITSDLTFDDSKARLILGWNPKPVLSNLIIE